MQPMYNKCMKENNVNNFKEKTMIKTLSNDNTTTDEMIAVVMPVLLDAVKRKAFVKGYKATDEEALGLVVSKFTKWNADAILTVTTEALEDANFSDLAVKVNSLDIA